MSEFAKWVDAHSHLADPRWEELELEEMLFRSQELGLGFFMQGGVGPEDWARQVELQKKYGTQIGLCFGLHPYFVAENSKEDCEIALDHLARVLPQAMGLGETGLDCRPHIMKDSEERQIDCFEKQLELAEVSQKPLVLHLVQAHQQALRVFDVWGVPRSGGLVHSFNGSAHQSEDFLKRGLYISVGGPVSRPDNQKLHQAVRETPLERLLIESDSPDQSPPMYKNQKNPSHSVLQVAESIATIKALTKEEVLEATSANFWRLFAASQKFNT